MAARLQSVVESYDPQLYHPRLGRLHLGVSIGYACFPTEGRDCASLMSAADSKMYLDKTERKLGNLANPDQIRRAQDTDSSGDRSLAA